MRVWRIEDPSSELGPYCRCRPGASMAIALMGEHHHSMNGHPTPYFPGEPFGQFAFGAAPAWTDDYIFGCHDLASLQKWFEDEWSDLQEAGYQIVTYEVEPQNLLDGRKQVAFIRSGDRTVEDWPEPERAPPRQLVFHTYDLKNEFDCDDRY